MIGIVYPFVILIGFYMILNGHNSPGGGFQGGTILSTVLITRYLVHPTLDLDLEIIEVIEKNCIYVNYYDSDSLFIYRNRAYYGVNE